jgi:hypothetical protein
MTKAPGPDIPKDVAFYASVGRCITVWAEVDEKLFDICADVLGCERDRASIVYYRSTLVSAKLALVDELVVCALPKRSNHKGDHPDVKEWKDIRKNIDTLLSVRTRIAHHPAKGGAALCYLDSDEIVPIGKSVSTNEARFTRVDLLYVGATEKLRGKHENIKPLRIKDLDAHYAAVKEAAGSLAQFRNAKLQTHLILSSQKGSTPSTAKSPSEAGQPIRVRIPIRSFQVKP